MEIMIFLLVLSFAIAAAVYFFSKRFLWSVFTFSALSNFILYGNLTYRNAVSHDLLWLFHFVRDIYPYVNIIFLALILVILFRRRYAE